MSWVLPAHRQPRVCDCGAHGFAGLTKGFTALFSPEALSLVGGRRWSALTASGKVYARYRRTDDGTDLMHRTIAAPGAGSVVDHINGDTLDNRAANLRVCAHADNLCNQRSRGAVRSKGVANSGDKFTASITRLGRRFYLGTYDTEAEAAAAYYAASLILQGDFRHKGSDPTLATSGGQ